MSLKVYDPFGKGMHQRYIQCLLVKKVIKDLTIILIESK